jgi:hypothetical protein
VRGELESGSLRGSRLFLQQELFTGFPGRRPPLRNCTAGVECCYDEAALPACVSAPYGKPCRGLLAAGIALQPASIGAAAMDGRGVIRARTLLSIFCMENHY